MRRLFSTNAIASASVMLFPRFWRCARASARGWLEPDNLAANDGRRIHDISVREGSHRHTRSTHAFPHGCGSFVRRNDTASSAASGRATARDLMRSRPHFSLSTGHAEPRRE